MPSTNQSNTGSAEYKNKECETVDRWDNSMLMDVIPETEESARNYLGAANKYDAPTEVKEHFANCIKRLQD